VLSVPRTPVLLGAVLLAPALAAAHDIPDARIDRAIQVTLRPGRLEVDYEVSLAELTLVQDLRRLAGPVRADDRMALSDRYARETAPLNARGLLVEVDGQPTALSPVSHEVAIEEHPRLTFHYEADLPPRGRLLLRDTNYVSSEGSSRLALSAKNVTISGYEGPSDIDAVPIRPLWLMSDDEERASKEVDVRFEAESGPVASGPVASRPAAAPPTAPRGGLAGLLDRSSGAGTLVLGLLALLLGVAHAVQPGHGKTLVAAASLGPDGGPGRAALLALVVTITHFAGVLVLAAGLALTRASRYEAIDRALAGVAGFTIAAVGFWRLGRYLGGSGEHEAGTHDPPKVRGLLGLGIAGGIVPCWDAILLVLLADALQRLALGVVLVGMFSLGMGLVLLAVGLTASRFQAAIGARPGGEGRQRLLGAAGGSALAVIGLAMLYGR
jgi:nickel/cobalt exporter